MLGKSVRMKFEPPSGAPSSGIGLPRKTVPAGYDRAASSLALQPLLQQFNVDLFQVLAESGLPPETFAHPDNLVPFRHGSRLLGLCAERTGCAHLGLLIGRHTPMESLGFVADLVKAAPHVHSALVLLARYLKFSDGGGLLALHEDSRFASCSYVLYEPGVEHDIVLGTLWNVLRSLCGDSWLPHEVQLMRRRPVDIRPYRSFFRAPLRFDCEQSSVVFDRKWLDIPLQSADPQRLNALVAQADAAEAQSTFELATHVRQIVRRQLLTGTASMDCVAAELAMNRRTLDRHLKRNGLSFKSLSDQLRYEIARHILSTTAMPVGDVAQSLRYANAGAFSTAFRRWSGHTPTQWRSAASAMADTQIDA